MSQAQLKKKVPALSTQTRRHIADMVSQTITATKNGNLSYKKAIMIIQKTLSDFPHDHSQSVVDEVMRQYLLSVVNKKKSLAEIVPENYPQLSAEELLTACKRIAKNPKQTDLYRTLLPVEVLITGKGNRLIFKGFSKSRKPPTIKRSTTKRRPPTITQAIAR